MKVRVNIHGIFSVTSASLIERKEASETDVEGDGTAANGNGNGNGNDPMDTAAENDASKKEGAANEEGNKASEQVNGQQEVNLFIHYI